MKKLITLTFLLGAFVFNAKAEIKTVILNQQNKVGEVEIQEGEVAEVLYYKTWVHQSEIGRVYFEKDGVRTTVFQNRLSTIGNRPRFAGPGKLIFKIYGNERTSVYSVEILNNTYGGTKNSGNNVTVLPKETENMELILESSDDMVKWEKDVIGDKPKANRKKFYRLRAVKK